MKTQIIIEIETKGFFKVYSEEEPAKHNKQTEITSIAEKEFHNLIQNNIVATFHESIGVLEEMTMEDHTIEGQEYFHDVAKKIIFSTKHGKTVKRTTID